MSNWNDLFKTIEVEEPEKHFVSFADKYIRPEMRVLDIGCGTGRHSLYLASKGAETHAIDVSAFALSVTKKKAKNKKLKIKTKKSSFFKLPYPNEYFDAVISVHVHNHGLYDDIKKSFSEINRILKGKGYFFLIAAPASTAQKFIKDSSICLEENTYVNLDLYDGDIPHHFFTKQEILENFKDFRCVKLSKYREESKWTTKGVIEKLLYIGQRT